MSSTNRTTHYDLSQYTANDKPTYLVDYNGDMSKIDAGIYGADSLARTNESSIGTLSNLNTTEKSSLVGAVNEVNTQVGTNTGNISTLTTQVGTNTGNIGTMASLTTTEKTSLVGAVNEVNGKANDLESELNINTFNTTTASVPSGYSLEGSSIKVATNSTGSLYKVYGDAVVTAGAWSSGYDITLTNTGLPAISESYTINAAVTVFATGGTSTLYVTDLVYNTNGSLTIKAKGFGNNTTQRFVLSPCLYFNTNFGD